jgi:hypothetical protein
VEKIGGRKDEKGEATTQKRGALSTAGGLLLVVSWPRREPPASSILPNLFLYLFIFLDLCGTSWHFGRMGV